MFVCLSVLKPPLPDALCATGRPASGLFLCLFRPSASRFAPLAVRPPDLLQLRRNSSVLVLFFGDFMRHFYVLAVLVLEVAEKFVLLHPNRLFSK